MPRPPIPPILAQAAVVVRAACWLFLVGCAKRGLPSGTRQHTFPPESFLGLAGLERVTVSYRQESDTSFGSYEVIRVRRGGVVVCEFEGGAYSSAGTTVVANVVLVSREPLQFEVVRDKHAGTFGESEHSSVTYELPADRPCRVLRAFAQ